MIHFPAPTASERLQLWQKSLPSLFKPEPSVDLKDLSDKYELTGAAILNIVYFSTLKSVSGNDELIRQGDIMEAIRREYRKEDRSIS